MKIVRQIAIWSFCHLTVDLICVAMILGLQKNWLLTSEQFWWMVGLYNLLAFGTQIGWGVLLDWWQKPKGAILVGLLLILVGLLLNWFNIYLTVILLGLGNAIFHVGGGSLVLNMAKNKATLPGIFVAPGALGLFFGMMIAKSGENLVWLLILLVTICLVMIFLAGKSEFVYQKKQAKINFEIELVIFLILLVIAVRSVVGLTQIFVWKSNFSWLLVSVIGVVLGKAFGGIWGDKFGWLKVGMGSLLMSIPLLIWGADNPVMAVIGLFLFNFTMPITLIVMANVMPGRPGLAFGATCLALIIGALPTILGLNNFFRVNWIEGGLILVSAIFLGIGLKYYFKVKHYIYGKNA